jgi:hypothetical protein
MIQKVKTAGRAAPRCPSSVVLEDPEFMVPIKKQSVTVPGLSQDNRIHETQGAK